ncbi:MAG: hypothetical protein KAW39_03085 [Thermoplasmata archaeon]|nr:hypothetical protein [Thermoplasmata archaeon]
MSQKRLYSVDRNLILRILQRGLGYPLVRVQVGDESISSIRMSPRSAFVYAALTGHGYLDVTEPELRYFVTKNMFRVFNQAGEHNLQNGIFVTDSMHLFCTPNLMAKEKPYISEGDKYVMPVVFDDHQELLVRLSATSNAFSDSGLNPHDVIVCPIRVGTKSTTELESFFEFVVADAYSREGYIVDTQIPFYYGVGTPDVAAYAIPDLAEVLREHGYIGVGGTTIDLMLRRLFGSLGEKDPHPAGRRDSIVFEVKTGQTEAPQILKYIRRGVFAHAYEVIPCEKDPEEYAGLVTVSKNGELMRKEGLGSTEFSVEKRDSYFDWLADYFKVFIISNLSNLEFRGLLGDSGLSPTKDDFVTWLRKTAIAEVVELVDSRIQTG